MSQITVSGNLKTITGSATQGSVQFQLINFGDYLPRILGTNAIVPVSAIFNANASGFWTGTVTGNDTIDPGGTNTPPTTYYSVTFIDASGKVIQSLPFQFTGSGPANLDSQAPITIIPVPSSPGVGNAATLTGNNVFTGQNSLLAYNIDGVLLVDGQAFPRTAAGINAAMSNLAGAAGIVFVPFAGNYSDTTILVAKNAVLIFGAGVFTVAGIQVPDSTTDATGTSAIYGQGVDRTTLFLANASNVDTITSPHMGTLTGGTNFWGVFHTTIANLTLDGNGSNQSFGYGIRLYGRAGRIYNVHIQNAKHDGLYLEWGGTQNETLPTGDDQWFVNNVTTVFSGSNGFTNKVSSDLNCLGLSSWQNGGWGVETFYSMHISQSNLFLNTSGGGHANGAGTAAGFFGSDVAFTTATGPGLLIDNGNTTASCLTACLFAGMGNSAIKIGSQGNYITGQAANSNTAVEFLASSSTNGNHIDLTTYGNTTGPLIKFNSLGGDTYIAINGTASGTMFDATPPNGAELHIDVIGVTGNPFLQLRSTVLNVNGTVYTFPGLQNDTFVGQNSIQILGNKTLTGLSNTVTLLNRQDPAAAITGNSGAQNLYSYTLPANQLAAGKGLRITCHINHSTGTANTAYAFNFDATTVVFTTSGNSGYGQLVAEVWNKAGVTNAQVVTTTSIIGASVDARGTTTSAIDTTASVAITCTFNVANTDAVTPAGFQVELIQ